jgi:hypothetical protein
MLSARGKNQMKKMISKIGEFMMSGSRAAQRQESQANVNKLVTHLKHLDGVTLLVRKGRRALLSPLASLIKQGWLVVFDSGQDNDHVQYGNINEPMDSFEYILWRQEDGLVTALINPKKFHPEATQQAIRNYTGADQAAIMPDNRLATFLEILAKFCVEDLAESVGSERFQSYLRTIDEIETYKAAR